MGVKLEFDFTNPQACLNVFDVIIRPVLQELLFISPGYFFQGNIIHSLHLDWSFTLTYLLIKINPHLLL